MTGVVATKVRDLTGPGRTDRFDVGGTDPGAGWRAPVVLFGDPTSVATGLEWTGSAGRGERARQVVRYVHGGLRWWGRRARRVTTVLPTDVITIGDAMFLHVMVCRELGDVRWTELHRSTDDGVTWRPTGVRWRAGHHDGLFQMLTWERGDDGFVHVLSTGFQRAHGLILQRVPEDRLTDLDAWEGWGFDGATWGWGRPPTVALAGRFGELSLRRVERHWMLAFFDEEHYAIDVMALDSPTADLHRAPRATVLAGCGWDDEDHGSGRVAQLYGGYILPGSTWADAHLVVSQWNTATNWPYRAMQFRVDLTSLRP